MSLDAPVTSSPAEAPLSGTEESSARFREAVRQAGGVLTGLGNALRRTSVGLTVAGLAALFATNMSFATNPAAAAELTAQQCQEAVRIGNGLMADNIGKISGDLAQSFNRFGASHCDLNTDWKIANARDGEVFGQFRVHLIRLRKEASAGGSVLARQ